MGETDDSDPGVDRSPLSCRVCGATLESENVVESLGPNESLSDFDGWYVHIHSLPPEGQSIEIDIDDVYAFCPAHLPDGEWPMEGQNPGFDPELEAERLRQQYGI